MSKPSAAMPTWKMSQIIEEIFSSKAGISALFSDLSDEIARNTASNEFLRSFADDRSVSAVCSDTHLASVPRTMTFLQRFAFSEKSCRSSAQMSEMSQSSTAAAPT